MHGRHSRCAPREWNVLRASSCQTSSTAQIRQNKRRPKISDDLLIFLLRLAVLRGSHPQVVSPSNSPVQRWSESDGLTEEDPHVSCVGQTSSALRCCEIKPGVYLPFAASDRASLNNPQYLVEFSELGILTGSFLFFFFSSCQQKEMTSWNRRRGGKSSSG